MNSNELRLRDLSITQIQNCLIIAESCNTIEEVKIALNIYIKKIKEN